MRGIEDVITYMYSVHGLFHMMGTDRTWAMSHGGHQGVTN